MSPDDYTFVSWEQLRAYLNHDVLCNQMRLELDSLRSDTTREPFRLKRWQQKRCAYKELIENSLQVLKPSQMLSLPEFDSWPQKMKKQVGQIWDEMNRLKLLPVLDKIKELLSESVIAIDDFLELPKSQRTSQNVEYIARIMAELSVEISRLPYPLELE
jgi:hypothetical protein